MKTTTLINETKNTFEERDKNTVLPFYQDSGAMFYKNKLINVEDIVEHYEMNTDDNNEFEAYSSKISYLLTFEDDKGDIHNHISPVKPKNIGAVYYYVIKDNKLKNIFPEKDRKKLKPYISIDTKYEYNNKSKIYSLASFVDRHHIKITAFLYPISSLLVGFLFSFFTNPLDAYLSACLFSLIIMFIPIYIADRISNHFHNESNIFVKQKENEERENILKTFI